MGYPWILDYYVHAHITCSKVHISASTLVALGGEFEVEEAHGKTRNKFLELNNVDTYFILGYSNQKRSLAEVRVNG